MNHIQQEEEMGCGVACLAMVTDEDYFTARRRFVRQDFTEKGLTHLALDRRIAEAGFAIQRRYPKKGEAWPPEPFAEMHICRVRVHGAIGNGPKAHHYVFMTEYGHVWDPAFSEGVGSLGDYARVLDVAGIFRTNRYIPLWRAK